MTDVNLNVLDTNTELSIFILSNFYTSAISICLLLFIYLLTYSLHLIGICPNISFLPIFENFTVNQVKYLLKHLFLLHKCINIWSITSGVQVHITLTRTWYFTLLHYTLRYQQPHPTTERLAWLTSIKNENT